MDRNVTLSLTTLNIIFGCSLSGIFLIDYFMLTNHVGNKKSFIVIVEIKGVHVTPSHHLNSELRDIHESGKGRLEL